MSLTYSLTFSVFERQLATQSKAIFMVSFELLPGCKTRVILISLADKNAFTNKNILIVWSLTYYKIYRNSSKYDENISTGFVSCLLFKRSSSILRVFLPNHRVHVHPGLSSLYSHSIMQFIYMVQLMYSIIDVIRFTFKAPGKAKARL